jgi:hypothetical protein
MEGLVTLLLSFLNGLDDRRLHCTLHHDRLDTIRVNVDFPGEIWEVEFFEDMHVEIETFRSVAGVKTTSVTELFALIDHNEESADRRQS